jgi:sterol desaturase/sphingolipid hydroxylase (fatty acid hydroxylase superfamily)
MKNLDSGPTHFGSGWISGVLSIALGAICLGAVLCLRFPTLLTTPSLREIYPLLLIRGLIQGSIVAAFILGTLSILLRANKILGGTGLAVTTVAVLLGGANAEVGSGPNNVPYVGMDWFLLNLFFLALIFVPLERLFPRRADQAVLRSGWKTDLAHFFFSHVFVQVTVFLTLFPAKRFFAWAVGSPLQEAVASQPYILQFLEIVIVSDLAEYWVHRAFHRVPLLWRMHAIHHSAVELDWLAASRMHLFDIVVTRAFTFLPIYLLGFETPPVFAYLVYVSFHAIFIHANVNFGTSAISRWYVTPRFHYWHHAKEQAAWDKNFAIHLPLIDRLFGTYYLPEDKWPAECGIEGNPVPDGYASQFIYPLKKDEPAED